MHASDAPAALRGCCFPPNSHSRLTGWPAGLTPVTAMPYVVWSNCTLYNTPLPFCYPCRPASGCVRQSSSQPRLVLAKPRVWYASILPSTFHTFLHSCPRWAGAEHRGRHGCHCGHWGQSSAPPIKPGVARRRPGSWVDSLTNWLQVGGVVSPNGYGIFLQQRVDGGGRGRGRGGRVRKKSTPRDSTSSRSSPNRSQFSLPKLPTSSDLVSRCRRPSPTLPRSAEDKWGSMILAGLALASEN